MGTKLGTRHRKSVGFIRERECIAALDRWHRELETVRSITRREAVKASLRYWRRQLAEAAQK